MSKEHKMYKLKQAHLTPNEGLFAGC